MQYNHLSKEELLIEIDKLKAKVTEFEKSEIIRLSAEQRNIQAENELLESEKKYKRLFEKSEDAILILQNGRFVDCNNAAIKMLRFDKKEEFLNTHPSELSPEKQRDGKMSFSKADEMIEIAFKNGSHRFEWDHKKSDGEIFPVEVLLTVIENTEKLQIIHTVWRDNSKRKQFENTIKESEERFKRLFDDLGDAVFVTRIGKANMGKIVEANAAAVIQTGYSREELLKMNIVYDLCIPGTGIISTDDWNEKLYKGDKVTNTEKKRKKDGSEYWTEVIVTPIEFKGEIAGLSINHDITSRKKAEDDLRESEEKYRTLIDNIQDGVFIINEGKLLFVNEAFAAIVGYTKDEVSGMDFKKFVAPEDWRMVLVNYAKMMQGESDINNLEFQAIHKDGFTRVYVNMTIDRINYDNKPVAFGTVKDISENKKMQELITLKEKYYRTLFDLSPTGIIVIDDKGFILDINESFCKYNGYTPAELKGANISILVPEDKQRDMDMHIKEILIGKNLRDEVINISKDGSPRNIELYETKVTLSDGQSGILSIANDITERTRTANVQNVIYKISYAVNLTDNLDELISIIREGLSTLIDTANFFVAIYEEETDTILLPYIADKKDTFTSFPAGKSLTAHVIKSKKPLFATKEVVAEMESKGIIESVGSDSEIWLGVPMILRDKVTGAIVVQSYDDENAYSLQDMEILDFVSQAISLSINRKKA
jgi:PAS domain S-box-containing protein